jgi:hypothetical protein
MKNRKRSGLAYLRRKIVLDISMQYRLLTAGSRMLPDFIVIGAMKCGSTSMYDYLKRHPSILPAYKKAAHYFDMNYSKGLDWYRAHFPLSSKAAQKETQSSLLLTGESSPYYIFHPLAAERAKKLLPNAKLIALLRNPVSRAYSHYHHMVRTNRENLNFEDAIDAESVRLAGVEDKLKTDDRFPMQSHRTYSYLGRGMYADQLERWFMQYPREQFLIMRSEDFFKNPGEVCARAHCFLGLEPFDLGAYKNANPGGYPPMNPETRQRLVEFFRPLNQRLFEMIGEDFGWNK